MFADALNRICWTKWTRTKNFKLHGPNRQYVYLPFHPIGVWLSLGVFMKNPVWRCLSQAVHFKPAGIARCVFSLADNNQLEKWVIVYLTVHRQRGRVLLLQGWVGSQIEESLSGCKAAGVVHSSERVQKIAQHVMLFFLCFQEVIAYWTLIWMWCSLGCM